MKTKLLLAALVIVSAVSLFGCRPAEITDFEQCAAAGYPVMESYPRQCKTPDGRTFVETVPPIQPPAEEVKLSYNIGGCGAQESKEYVKARGPMEAGVDFEIAGGFLNLTHHLNYVCCAKIEVHLDSLETLPEHTLIKIREKNEGQMCRCVCDYDVGARIGPLKQGKYLVQIWGVEFEQMPVELAWEKEIEIQHQAGLPNPASVYCIDQGGDLEIRKDEQGGEYGVCIFPDRSECEEWAFFRGECKPSKPETMVVKQSGGAGMLIAECQDRAYIESTADYIIEGVVESVESKWNEEKTSILTYSSLAVQERVKFAKSVPDKLQIATPGGCVGEVCEAVEDQPIFHEGKKVRIYFEEIDGEFSIICAQFGVEELEMEAFCGWSTNGTCSTDAECVSGGCSGQVCQSQSEEPAITTCEFRQCYDASAYGLACKCVNAQCKWQ